MAEACSVSATEKHAGQHPNARGLLWPSRRQRGAEGISAPPTTRPPMPVILFRRAEPPALSLASRRSLRRRACSEARCAAASASLDVAAALLSAMAEAEGVVGRFSRSVRPARGVFRRLLKLWDGGRRGGGSRLAAEGIDVRWMPAGVGLDGRTVAGWKPR